MRKNSHILIFGLVLAILIALGFVLSIFFQPQPAKSASTDNVSGWAWSETIGWISFNCTDRGVCPSSNYGVNIDSATGNFSGYAWSENIGWINFSPSGPYPEAPNYSVKYNSETGKVTGWARAVGYGGGWDGWILFGKDAGGWTNQVTIESGTGEFHGWAWGSDVVGWISFNCDERGVCGSSNYKVLADIGFPPSVSCNDAETWNYCSDSRNPTLGWNYSDPDSDPQESYQLQIDDNSGFSSPEIDTGEVFSSGTSYHPTGTTLGWGTAYYWRIKVKDDQDNWSDWCAPTCSFATPLHAYPEPDFNWVPSNPSALEPVNFIDQTTFYNGGNSWFWTFESAVPVSSVLQNPIATFSDQGNWDVTLEATDGDGFMCPITKAVNVAEPLPEWREIKP